MKNFELIASMINDLNKMIAKINELKTPLDRKYRKESFEILNLGKTITFDYLMSFIESTSLKEPQHLTNVIKSLKTSGCELAYVFFNGFFKNYDTFTYVGEAIVQISLEWLQSIKDTLYELESVDKKELYDFHIEKLKNLAENGIAEKSIDDFEKWINLCYFRTLFGVLGYENGLYDYFGYDSLLTADDCKRLEEQFGYNVDDWYNELINNKDKQFDILDKLARNTAKYIYDYLTQNVGSTPINVVNAEA